MPFNIVHPFEVRAIAFLDVLGFKSLIKDAESLPHKFSELLKIINVLDGHVKFDNQNASVEVPDLVRPKYIFISDSLIFSAPLQYKDFDGLAIVVAKTIQIAHKLLQMGYLFRGCINIGSVWQTSSNIFGTGYIDAFQAEGKLTFPQVVLTDEAKVHWQKNLASKLNGTCFVDADGKLHVDILNPNYLHSEITSSHGGIERQFLVYRNWIIANLGDFAENPSVLAKWDWMAKYFNATIKRHGISADLI